MHRRTTNAILLRARPLREADLLLTFFTEDEGKLSGVAAHARRSQRRFGGALEAGTIGTVTFASLPGDTLARIEEMRVQWSPLAVRGRLPAFAALGVLLDIVDATTVERQSSGEKFALIKTAIRDLAEAPQRTLLTWLVQWFEVLGMGPRMDACVRCGTDCPTEAVARFTPQEGGLICDACWRGGAWSMPFDAASRALWLRLRTGDGQENAESNANAESYGVRYHAMAVDTVREGAWQSVLQVTGRSLKCARYWEMVWNGQ